MDKWLLENLVCPRDKQKLTYENDSLACADGHSYPVFDGIPVMLVDDAETTHDYITKSIEQVSGGSLPANEPTLNDGEIDDFVQKEIPYTSGIMYFAVQNKLKRYPIPEFRLHNGNGRRLLDVGCNWGRWTIAAAKNGFRPVGMDPSLDAVLAARRVSKQLGVETNFVVGDARFLPFADNAFDTIFSYGVFQHLSKENVRTSIAEAARVLRENGSALFQMPNKHGIRSYQQRRRRGFTEGEGFEVRYWTPAELHETFEKHFGKMKLTADSWFGLGVMKSDADLMPFKYKTVIYSSDLLIKLSRIFPPLARTADSVYLGTVDKKK